MEVTVAFYVYNATEGETHSGYATTTEPFSRVDWFVNDVLQATDYPDSSTPQTDSYHTVDFTGLGSADGSGVTIRAAAYDADGNSASAEHVVTVTSTAGNDSVAQEAADDSSEESDASMIPVEATGHGALAYPTAEALARCEDVWWQLWDWTKHEMTVKVEVGHVGDPNDSYIQATVWKGHADLQITRHREGGTIQLGAGGLETVPEINELLTHEDAYSNLPEAHQLYDPDDHRIPIRVTARAVEKTSGKQTTTVGIPGLLATEYTTGHTRAIVLEWVASDSVSISANVLQGLEPYSLGGLAATTYGKAECDFPQGVELNPNAWANHYSPNRASTVFDRCSHSSDESEDAE